MRALKLVGIVIGALIVLMVLGAIALTIFINPNDYRSDIERLAKQRTGRDLQIAGKIDLKLFPWIALEIHDVTLGNPRGYSAAVPFVAVKTASVGVKLLPLLRNHVEVRKVTLDGLNANLVSRSATENNWKDFGQKTPESAAETSAPAGTMSATVEGVDITHSGVSYSDEEKHTVQKLANLEVHLGAIGGNTPVKTSVALDYETEKGPVGHIELQTLLRMPQDGPIEARDLKLQALLKKETKSVPVVVTIPALVLDLKAQSLAQTSIDASYDGILLQLTVAGTQLFGDRDLHGTFALPDTRAVPKPLTHLAANASFKVGKTDAHLTALDVHLDDSHITGAAGIEDLDRMAMSFDLAIDRIDLDRYMAKGAAPAQSAKAPPVQLPLETIRGFNAHGVLKVGEGKIDNVVLTELSLPVDAAAGLVKLAPTAAKLYGGTYNGELQLDARPPTALLALDQHLHGVDLGAFAQALFKTDHVVGRGDADVKLNSSGNTDDALIAGLTGKVQMNVRDGAFNGVDLWYEIRAARALLSAQVPPAHSGPARTAFKALSASATLDHGLARNDDLKVDADYLKVGGKGTVNLASKALDYRLIAQVSQIPPEGAGSELKDLKSLQIPVTITGTLDDMKIRPDLQGILKSKVKDELKKQLGDKLKGLFGR